MRIVVLVDNNTYIDQYYLGEPAACYYIEEDDAKILLDVGYSDVFVQNARKMNIDLKSITHIALSHGHNDHTRGLKFLFSAINAKNIDILAHPDAFCERYENTISIGCPVEQSLIADKSNLRLTKEPYYITKNTVFLGEIPAYNDFERTRHVGFIKENGVFKEDFVRDDSAVAYKGDDGLFIITGCSHSGICNIVEHAKKVCNETRISGILGGFHLFEVSEQLLKTIKYFTENAIENVYPCHCVSFAAKAEINKHIPIHEVGVGLTIDI